MARHIVASTAEIPPGTNKVVSVKGREIAVFNVKGSVISIENESGRHETWGQTSAPLVRPARWMSRALRWEPSAIVSSAV